MAARTRWMRTLKRVVAVLLTLLVIEYLLLPQLAGARTDLLAEIHLGYLALGIVFETAFLVAYALLTRAMLPRGEAPSLPTLLRINLSTLAVSHVIPGGTAAGTALGYRLLTQAGVRATDAGFALGMQGFGSAVVLNAILWVSLVVSIPARGFDPLYVTAAVLGSILIGAFLTLVLMLTRGETQTVRIVRAVARRIPILDDDMVHRGVHRIADRLRVLLADRALLVRAFVWAAVAWLLDALSLAVMIAAFGHRVSLIGLLIAFGVANVLAAIPISPRGLGVVEAVLIPTLAGFGTPPAIATLGVLAYRLFNFWLPVPIGAVAYLSLRAKHASLKKKAEEVRRLGEFSLVKAETPREWALRHGLKLGRPAS